MPAPRRQHQTPSISIGRHGKEWFDTEAQHLVQGDMILGEGIIKEGLLERIDGPFPSATVTCQMLSGKNLVFKFDEIVRVFGIR